MPNGGGHKADPGQLNAGAQAFNQEGTELAQASGKVVPNVAAGQVGTAWQGVAEGYTQAFTRFKDATAKYGTAATQFGGQLTNAASSYSSNEENQQQALKNAEG